MQKKQEKNLRFIDFCAGIGAGRLGLERGLDAVCVGYSEISKTSINTYNILHNTTNEKNFGDLTKLDVLNLPDFDVMIAGFPCQTFSIIGQRQGLEDDRGLIIYHLINILTKKSVPYFILENVKGLINHDKGNTIKVFINALEEADYDINYKVLNSIDYGVPQMRERVYFVGIKKDKTNGRNKFEWPSKIPTPNVRNYLCGKNNVILPLDDKTFQNYLRNKYNIDRVDINKILKKDYLTIDTRQSDLRTYEHKIPTLRTGRHGLLYVKNGKLLKLSGYESLLLQGFDKKHATRVSGEVSEQNLLSQAGNAMTVSVIEQIARQLKKYILENM